MKKKIEKTTNPAQKKGRWPVSSRSSVFCLLFARNVEKELKGRASKDGGHR